MDDNAAAAAPTGEDETIFVLSGFEKVRFLDAKRRTS
jgi:hypothetical protein